MRRSQNSAIAWAKKLGARLVFEKHYRVGNQPQRLRNNEAARRKRQMAKLTKVSP